MTQTQDTQTLPARQNTAVQRKFDPLAPVGDSNSLKGLMESQRASLTAMLPKHITPERLFKTMLVAANRNQDLFSCTQMSILETINRAAELGLDLSGTLGEAYPVPFNNRVKTQGGGEIWVKQCQLIIGYRGYAKLARQTGEIKRIEADVVCKNDKFILRKGSNATCEFEPCLGERGEPIGAFAFVQFKDDGEQFDFMPVEDIEKIRRRSKSGSNKEGHAIGAWKTDWAEMAKKSVFRRVAKWLPLSTEKFVRAMEMEGDDFAETVEASNEPAVPQGSKTERVLQEQLAKQAAAKVTSRPVSEGQTLEPTPEALAEAAKESNAKDQVLGAGSAMAAQTGPSDAQDAGGGAATEAGHGDGNDSPSDADDTSSEAKEAQASEHGTTVVLPKTLLSDKAMMDALGEAAMDLSVEMPAQQEWLKANLSGTSAWRDKNMKPAERMEKVVAFIRQAGGNPVAAQ